MTPQTPHHPIHVSDDALPALQLPPVPFLRAARGDGNELVRSDPMPQADARPSGTSIDALMATLTADASSPAESLNVATIAPEPVPAPVPVPEATPASAASLAPQHELLLQAEPLVQPQPQLEYGLQPARPFDLPTRGVAAATQRSARATMVPFPTSAPLEAAAPPAQPLDAPPAPTSAPEPPCAPPAAPDAISSIYGNETPGWPQAVGRLAAQETIREVAASPQAWYGGSVVVDDAMLVWNGTSAAAPTVEPTAPLVASHPVAPMPMPQPQPTAGASTPPIAAPAPPSAIAPRRATTATAAGAAGAAAPRSRSLGRLAVMIGTPATIGIGAAVAIDRFLL